MSFIGAYVENLSPDQLSVGINNGSVFYTSSRMSSNSRLNERQYRLAGPQAQEQRAGQA